jgi:hypothetical protein
MVSYRQGDVIIERVRTIPDDAAEQKCAVIVLAHGEATGHAHTISAESATMLLTPSGEKFLTIRQPVELIHQEHAPITIKPGKYRFRQQREYSPEEIRNVAD